MKVLMAIDPYCQFNGEISEAIAAGANQDPLFPSRPDGCARTAAILCALAWFGSNFFPTRVGNNGHTFGLYGIKPPPADVLGKPIVMNQLTNAHDATLIAIDLVRSSLLQARERGGGWEEGLLDYFTSCSMHDNAKSLFKSFEVIAMADDIVAKHWSEKPYAQLPPPEAERKFKP
jgi:hypothetical protein